MHRIVGMRPVGLFLAVNVLLAAASGAFAESSADGCSQINKLVLKDVSAIDAQLVESGNLKFGDGTAAPEALTVKQFHTLFSAYSFHTRT